MKLDIEDGRIICRDVPMRLNTVMQKPFGSRHVRGTDDWTYPLTWVAINQLTNDLENEDYEVSSELKDWVAQTHTHVLHLHDLNVARDAPGDRRLIGVQRVGTEFQRSAKRAINAFALGGGKTVICTHLANQIESRTFLVACPKTVIDVWEQHFHAWTDDITPIVATDSAKKRRDAISKAVDLAKKGRRVALIMNYESVWRHTKLSPYGNLRMEKCGECDPTQIEPVSPAKCEVHEKELNQINWDTVICDEAHRVINVSKQTRGIWYLSREAEWVWPLTGTPSRGNFADFWSLLRLCDPDAWPSKTKFIDRYCESYTDEWGNLIVSGLRRNMEKEFRSVADPYMIRRTFDEVMRSWAESRGEKYVPIEVINDKRYVALSKDQKKLYDELADRIFATTDSGKIIFSDNALTEMVRLLQVSSAMLDVVEREDDHDELVMVSPSPKVDELINIMGDIDEPAAVYTVNRGLAELARDRLAKEGYRVSMVHGGIPREIRDTEITRFQESDSQVFIATYAAAAEGITLTAARYLIRLQLSWSMILNEQAEGRILRYGQTADQVVYITVLAEDTVESRVDEAYGDKLDALEAVVQDATRMKELVYG